MSGLLFNIFAVLPPWGPQNFSLRPSASSLVLDGKWCFPIPHSLDVVPPKFTLQVLTLHFLTTFQHFPKGRKLWSGNKRHVAIGTDSVQQIQMEMWHLWFWSPF